MECLKCGRQTSAKEVFCDECLKVMAANPVKPDTPVILPRRDRTERRVPAKKQPKPEEIIAQLHKTIKGLWIAIAILGILLTACAGSLGVVLYQKWTQPEIGSNYSTIFSDPGGNP